MHYHDYLGTIVALNPWSSYCYLPYDVLLSINHVKLKNLISLMPTNFYSEIFQEKSGSAHLFPLLLLWLGVTNTWLWSSSGVTQLVVVLIYSLLQCTRDHVLCYSNKDHKERPVSHLACGLVPRIEFTDSCLQGKYSMTELPTTHPKSQIYSLLLRRVCQFRKWLCS